jgi:hypothetical protein
MDIADKTPKRNNSNKKSEALIPLHPSKEKKSKRQNASQAQDKVGVSSKRPPHKINIASAKKKHKSAR